MIGGVGEEAGNRDEDYLGTGGREIEDGGGVAVGGVKAVKEVSLEVIGRGDDGFQGGAVGGDIGRRLGGGADIGVKCRDGDVGGIEDELVGGIGLAVDYECDV